MFNEGEVEVNKGRVVEEYRKAEHQVRNLEEFFFFRRYTSRKQKTRLLASVTRHSKIEYQ